MRGTQKILNPLRKENYYGNQKHCIKVYTIPQKLARNEGKSSLIKVIFSNCRKAIYGLQLKRMFGLRKTT